MPIEKDEYLEGIMAREPSRYERPQVAAPQITEDQRNFLRIVKSYTGEATLRECGLADRKQDRARQKSRRQGLVTFDGGYWRLTDLGSAALRQGREST